MVQQNLVSYIISQMRQGKRLEEINKFLVDSGYDKAEVESSVQYVLNTQTNPRVAEEQRIQQLAAYIQNQLNAGYASQTIANFLISRGYPYYEVNSALQQATAPKKEVKIEHKLVVFALIAMFVMTAAVTVMYFRAYTLIGIGVPEKLLDVETERLSTIVQQGGELAFQVKLINFGYEKRFDVMLEYSVIDRETQGVVLEKTETVALSTTLENVVRFAIPEEMKPGRYVLRVDATYKDFTATSGFVFDLLPKELAEERLEEIRKELPPVEAEIPELAPEGPAAGEEAEIPEAVPTPITPPAEREKKFYEGKTRQQAFEMVKAVSVREPERAIEMCKELRLEYHQEECIKTIAKFKQDGVYCQALDEAKQDTCFFELVLELKKYELCDFIKDANIKQSCKVMEMAGQAEGFAQSGDAAAAAEAFKGFELDVQPFEGAAQ